MDANLRNKSKAPGMPLVQALEAVKALEGMGHDDPVIVAYNPLSRGNPYQQLLYQRVWDHGIAPLPLVKLDQLDMLRPLLAEGITTALHIHWTSPVLEKATDDASAENALTTFLTRLDAFLGDGGKLILSIHNMLPHDARLPEWETKLQREIIDRAAMLHILTKSTPARVSEFFTIPDDRTLHVPHPHYIGAYPDYVSKALARHELSVDVGETTYAFVGAIRPYKGLDMLLDAFGTVAAPLLPRRRLLVAGRPLEHADVDAFRHRCLLDARITIRATKVPDEEMQYYLRASDLAILPYQRSLNSGVLMLALSFGLPVIAPDDAGTAEILDPSFSRTFRPGDKDSLIAAIRAADELLTPAAAEAALAAARRYDPGPLSIRFAEGLRKFLG